MSNDNIIDLNTMRVACSECSLLELCLPAGLEAGDVDKLEKLIKRNKPLHRRDTLFREGDAMQAIYVVRSGCFKTCNITENGTENVIGFHLPGELMGLDAIATDLHRCTAVALDTSSVCEMPFEKLQTLADQLPSLHHQLIRIMSQGLASESSMNQLLGSKDANGKIASFLLSLSDRMAHRGFSRTDYNLEMSRNDIANFLGLAVETVSRTLTKFQDQGIITVHGRGIKILKMDTMSILAGRVDSNSCSKNN